MARIKLANGCEYTVPNVWPKNWKTVSASVKKHWYITYRFHDLAHKDRWPQGYPVMVKGMNLYADLKQRQAATAQLLEDIKRTLEEAHYNPITAVFETQALEGSYIIHPTTNTITALRAALPRLKILEPTQQLAGYTIAAFEKGIAAAQLSHLAIESFSRRHVIAAMDAAERLKGPWSAPVFNKHRTNLFMLWKELVQVQAVEVNPLRDIEPRKVIRKIRETLSPNERQKINTFLAEYYPAFWRFLHIFFHSGAREAELMRLQGKDVDLAGMRVKYTVRKGRQYAEVFRPIKNSVLELWQQAMVGCSPEDYVFAKGLQPGEKPIDEAQIGRRWRAHVKGKKQSRSTGKNKSTIPRLDIEVTADFYSLKHTNLTEMRKLLSKEEAAKAAGHSSTKMLDEHYDVEREADEFEQIRNAGNKFA